MAIEGFIRKAPLAGTQYVELPAHQVAQLIAKGKEIIPSKDETEVRSEEAKEKGFESLVCEEDFEVFYCPDLTKDATTTSTPTAIAVSADHDATKVPEGMVIEKRLPNLLYLLESHIDDATPQTPVVPRPLTPLPPPQTDLANKKRKWDKKVGKGIAEEGEIQEETPLEQTKGPKATWP